MNTLISGDCLDIMQSLPKKSVDLICTDLPYGITNNKWDVVIPMDRLWEQFTMILSETGCVVLTAAQPFASLLVMSNLEWFKYDIIWQKTVASGQLNVNSRPLRTHEHILVFAPKMTTYNEQKTLGEPYKIKRSGVYKNANYNTQTETEKDNDGYRHATSVVTIANPRISAGHPTQKPVELMEYIIRTYSNTNDTVLDCCMGSGATGVAAINLYRKFIGIELNQEYFKGASQNIIEALETMYIGADMTDYLTVIPTKRQND